MTEEQDVITTEAATVSESTEQNEQTEVSSGDVTQTVDGKDYKAIAEQLSRDIKEKNRKIQELKTQVRPTEAVSQPEVNDDDAVKRFIKVEATTMVNNKMLTDPTFKDRVSIVSDYIEQGYTFDMADKLAKADIMDKILTGSSEEASQTLKPKQITPKAIPEETVVHSTGNVLDDIEKGLVEVEPEVAAMLAKYRNKG